MSKLSSLHHLAISTADMKTQIKFFSEVLGMELVALYWMHGVEGAWHGFMRLEDGSSIAFVFLNDNEKLAREIGKTHAGTPAGCSSPGTLQHVALNTDSMENLLGLRDRIRSHGVPVIGPIHHGLCSSIYFAGPENLTLEIATSANAEHPLDSIGTWIDPEVVKEAGISEEELKVFCNPEPFQDENGAVPQPEYDPEKYHQTFPEEHYMKMIKAPDDLIAERSSVIEPPSPGGYAKNKSA